MSSLIKLDGKPLEKLIDAISKGIGDYRRPGQIRREADAKAYEIITLEKAKHIAHLHNQELDQNFVDRMNNRIIEREIWKQQNIDAIILEAKKQLQNESVSDDPVEKDWSIRFFNIVEDVAQEELQMIWAKILAGEVKKPKSFSLRTLELLKNLSMHEAKIFLKLANYAICSENVHFIFSEDEEFLKTHSISVDNRLLLDEIGLINLSDLNFTFSLADEEQSESILNFGTKKIIFTLTKANSHCRFNILPFTSIGIELLRLIQLDPDDDYIHLVFNRLLALKFPARITS